MSSSPRAVSDITGWVERLALYYSFQLHRARDQLGKALIQ